MTSPFTHSDQWGSVVLGGRTVPGIIVSIDGAERPHEWLVQRAVGTSGSYTTWRGEKPAESIKLLIVATTVEDFEAMKSFRKYLVPIKGKRPPAFKVENEVINFNGITRVSIKLPGQPQEAGKGKWTWALEFIDFWPHIKAPIGKPSPANLKGDPKPKDEAEVIIDNLLQEIKKA
jgi:hypothetical protein